MPLAVPRRHHIPKQRRRVTNWRDYDASLRQRGSLTVWFTDEAVAAWEAEPRTTPGGQPHYSALAITTALTRHRQLDWLWSRQGRRGRPHERLWNAYARAATPVTSAQVWKAWVRAARYWLAGR
jgi:hypothetical protein